MFLHSNKKLLKNEQKTVVTLIRDILKGTGQKDLELRTNYCLCKSVSIGLPSLRYYSFIHLSMLFGLPWSYFLLSCAHSKSYKTERCGTKNEKCNKNELAIYDTLTVSHQIFYTFCYSSDLHSDINLAMKITFVSNSFQTSL